MGQTHPSPQMCPQAAVSRLALDCVTISHWISRLTGQSRFVWRLRAWRRGTEGCGLHTVPLTVAEEEKMGAAMREKQKGGDKRLKTPLIHLSAFPRLPPSHPAEQRLVQSVLTQADPDCAAHTQCYSMAFWQWLFSKSLHAYTRIHKRELLQNQRTIWLQCPWMYVACLKHLELL